MTRAIAACICLAVLPAAMVVARAATDDRKDVRRESFRAGIAQIEVPAIVTNKAGAFAANLTAADFDVREDGALQEISSLALPSESRVYLMILDDLQTDPQYTERTRRAARQFVEQFLTPTDVIALTFTSGAKAGFAEFSVDRTEALRAIGAFNGLKESSATRRDVRTTDADYQPYQDPRSGEVLRTVPGQTVGIGERLMGTDRSSSLDARSANSALQSITTLARLAEAMAQVALPRRPIIYLSPGLPHDDAEVSEESNQYIAAIRKSLHQAIGIATRGNVSVYAIDPRGGVFGEEKREFRSAESLRHLASETGGFAAVAANDFTQTFARVVNENSHYYVLGYYPAKPKADGKFHKVTVTVRNRPDLTVVARNGYWAPDAKQEARERRAREKAQAELEKSQRAKAPQESARPQPQSQQPAAGPTDAAMPAAASTPASASTPSATPSAAEFVGTAAPEASSAIEPSPASVEFPTQLMSQLVDMLGSPQGTRGLPLRLAALSFAPKGRKVAVLAHVKTDGGVPLQTRQDRFTTQIGTAYAAVDESGRIVSNGQGVLAFNLSPDEADHMKTTGFRWMSHFEVDPGTYQVRIAAAEPVEGRKGSLIVDIDVPDYRRDIALSCMLVRSPAAARRGIGSWRLETLATKMSVTRVFSQDDVLAAGVEVYERKPRPTQIITRILTSDRREVLTLEQSFGLDEIDHGQYVSYRTIPLAHLAPGTYVLQFEARLAGEESGSPSRSRSRDLPFTVVKAAADTCDRDTPDTPRSAGAPASDAPCAPHARGATP